MCYSVTFYVNIWFLVIFCSFYIVFMVQFVISGKANYGNTGAFIRRKRRKENRLRKKAAAYPRDMLPLSIVLPYNLLPYNRLTVPLP